jgi:hypothetical protein
VLAQRVTGCERTSAVARVLALFVHGPLVTQQGRTLREHATAMALSIEAQMRRCAMSHQRSTLRVRFTTVYAQMPTHLFLKLLCFDKIHKKKSNSTSKKVFLH